MSGEAAGFASKAHSTSLPKRKWLREARQEHPCAVGRKCWVWAVPGLPRRAWGRQWAAVCSVGGQTMCSHCVGLPLRTSVHCLLWDLLTCSPEFCSSHIQDPSVRGRNTISNSTYSILSTTSLALPFQANIVSSQRCFPTRLPPRTCSSHFPSTPQKRRGETWHAINEGKRRWQTKESKRELINNVSVFREQ